MVIASLGSGSYNHVRAFELQLNPGLIRALAQSKSEPHLTRISTLNLIIKRPSQLSRMEQQKMSQSEEDQKVSFVFAKMVRINLECLPLMN